MLGREVRGVVRDDDVILKGVIVQVVEGEDPIAFTRTGEKGEYRISFESLSDSLSLVFSMLDYEERRIRVGADSIYDVVMIKRGRDLSEFVVRAPHTRVKGDTIMYDVASMTSKTDRSIGDVIRKIPGVSIIDNAIYYDGMPINRFYIEGLNMLGGSYSVATENINPEDVKTISVYERHQPKKVLNNIEDSERAALNLTLKKRSMLKPVGYLRAGTGFGERMLYTGNLYGMLISPSNQTIISAEGNNTGSLYSLIPGRKVEDGGEIPPGTNLYPLGIANLPGSRYFFNDSFRVSGNTLFKLKEDFTLTARTSYSKEMENYTNSNITEYLATGEENILYREDGKSELKGDQVNVTLNLERNSDRLYFIEELSFRGMFIDNSYMVLNPDKTDELLRNKDYVVRNKLNATIRTGDNVFDVGSELSFVSSPDDRMTVLPENEIGKDMIQVLGRRSFVSKINAGYTSLWNDFTFGGVANFDFNHESFISKIGDELPENRSNDDSGYKVNLSVSPFFNLRKGNVTWKTELPISFTSVRYVDHLSDRVYEYSRPHIDFSTSFFWRMTAYLSMRCGVSKRHNLGGIKDFVDSAFYTSYRTRTVLGTGELSSGASWRGNIIMRYSNPMAGWNVSGSLSLGKTLRNILSSSSVGTTEITTSSLGRKNDSRTLTWIFDGSKRFASINAVMKLAVNGVNMNNETMRQNRIMKVESGFYTFSATWISYLFSDRLSADMTASYGCSRQKIRSIGTETNLSNFNGNLKLSGFILPDLELYGSVSMERGSLAEGGMRGYLFLDGGLRLKKRRYEVELKGMNLTDEKRYEYSVARSLDISTYSYDLRPLEVLLTFKYSF